MTHPGRTTARVLAVALATFTFASCSSRTDEAPPPAPASAAAPAAAAATALPAGHPPLAAGGGMGGHGAPAGVGGVTWTPPAEWRQEKPSSGMRQAQYRVPGPGGDAECVVYYFGAGEGGDAQSNAERWAGQFSAPDGKPAALKTTPVKAGGMEVMLVEVVGTYLGGPTMGAPAPAPQKEAMLLGAIAKGPDANWFFKFTGPQATVLAQRAAFEAMVRSLSRKG